MNKSLGIKIPENNAAVQIMFDECAVPTISSKGLRSKKCRSVCVITSVFTYNYKRSTSVWIDECAIFILTNVHDIGIFDREKNNTKIWVHHSILWRKSLIISFSGVWKYLPVENSKHFSKFKSLSPTRVTAHSSNIICTAALKSVQLKITPMQSATQTILWAARYWNRKGEVNVNTVTKRAPSQIRCNLKLNGL